MIFYYSAIIIHETEIVEINGTHTSISQETAIAELAGCGLKIIEIHEATRRDAEIDRLKKLREKMSPKPILSPMPPPLESRFISFLRYIFGEK